MFSSNDNEERLYELFESMVKQKEIDKLREKLVEHLLEHGWFANYKYIESQKKENSQIKDDEEDVDFNVLIRGEYEGDYHLITECEKYTVRLKKKTAAFWRKDNWLLLGEFPIDEIKLTKKGIKCEIVTIEVE